MNLHQLLTAPVWARTLLLCAATLCAPALSPLTASLGLPSLATSASAQQARGASGTVKNQQGEPVAGAVVALVGTKRTALTDQQGRFQLTGAEPGQTLRLTAFGYKRLEQKWQGQPLELVVDDLGGSLGEVVVTAMGIMRKEKSLTYATQQIKSDDLTRVQDVNVAGSLEGKISGITVTPNAGGAGGASKIQLRGAQSILGNNAPLIVVDGVPMTNETRGRLSDPTTMTQQGSITEGSDPLSMINPDDIESMNVLKGANAAALYGSRAANGVIMITTKKGKEGKLDVTFTSNVTFDKPMTLPKFQNTYGATIEEQSGLMSIDSWGAPIAERTGAGLLLQTSMGKDFLGTGRTVHLRSTAEDDAKDFYRTGVTTNNSIALSGGTERVKSYFSYANSHALGLLEENSYNRNTLALRQSYRLWKRVNIEASLNYMQTKTKNRLGGGTALNPIYDVYTMPRGVDLAYYKDHYATQGEWLSRSLRQYQLDPTTGQYVYATTQARLSGISQEWAYQSAGHNNPYWLMKQNQSVQREDRVYGYVSGKWDIWDGLSLQARVSIDHTKYDGDSRRYATTQGPAVKSDYGNYWKDIYKTSEIYTDYLLSYNKTIKDFSLSATAGWVGHVINGSQQKTDVEATYKSANMQKLPTAINQFITSAGDLGATSYSKSNNWDKAALVTAQVGWKDAIYIDGSYRRDWYRAFRQFEHRGTPDNYGYFSLGASAVVSDLCRLPQWLTYLKGRLSYSEVGNSIPNQLYSTSRSNWGTGAGTVSSYIILHPIPEKTKSFEAGVETQMIGGRLGFDLTFYNTGMHDSYLLRSTGGKTEAVNSGYIRNRGLETTISYNFAFAGDWRWRTALNFAYNKNRIMKTYRNDDGSEALIATDVAQGSVRVRYREGGSYGDMYVTDFKRYT